MAETAEASGVSPVLDGVAAKPRTSRKAQLKLKRAEEDLSMYAAILGRRPTVAPEADAAADEKRFSVSLHLNLPPLPHMLRRNSRAPMLKLPAAAADSAARMKMSSWLRQVSSKARRCVDDVWMRLAS